MYTHWLANKMQEGKRDGNDDTQQKNNIKENI